MNKCMFFKVVCAFIGILFLCTCSDDPYYGNYENGYASDLNRLYSNKSIHPERNGNLELTYNGGVMLGKEIYFEMATSKTARLKFYDVFPGEREILLEPFELTKSNEGYIFTTQSATPMGTTFELSGSIEDGKLKVALNNVKMPDNVLSQKGTFKMMQVGEEYLPSQKDSIKISFSLPFLMDWYYTAPDSTTAEKLFPIIYGMDLSLLVQSIVSQLMFLMLPDVTFNPDGNITASYASLSEDFNILNLILGGVTEDQRGEIQNSPLNLIHYYIKDNSVYVVPNIEMIMYTIQTNQSHAEKVGDETALDLASILLAILDVYPTVKDWATKGIRFNLKPNDPQQAFEGEDNIYMYYKGDYQLYVDETEFYIDDKGKRTLFSVLIPLIPGLDELNIDLGTMTLDIGEYIKNTQYTSSLKLGLYLSTEN